MVRRLSLVMLAASCLLVLLFARIARADQPGPHTVPVAVVTFDSDDAEEQADALTGALRSRIRASQGWSLIETTPSLGMLTAALKCAGKPPSVECQQKIADQIKADRYLWGYVSKAPGGQVAAEVHLYQKGKPDTVVKESYAETLKDANDDTLRKIAQRIVDRLGGTALGVVVVRAGDLNGEVIIDGEKRVPLHHGAARIEVAAGGHSIEISAPGAQASKRNVLVTAGRDTVLDMPVSKPPPADQPPEKPFPTRKVIGGVALGAGAVLGALAVQQFVLYNDLQDRGKEIAKTVPKDEKPCDPGGSKEFCDTDKKSKTASALSIGFASAGVVALGVGVIFLFTGGDSTEKPTATAKKTRIVPQVGRTTGLTVVGSF